MFFTVSSFTKLNSPRLASLYPWSAALPVFVNPVIVSFDLGLPFSKVNNASFPLSAATLAKSYADIDATASLMSFPTPIFKSLF